MGPEASATRDDGSAARPRRGRESAPSRLIVLLGLVSLACSGCSNFVSPWSQWRAAYDNSLFRRISKDELNDVSGSADSGNFMERWLAPKAGHAAIGRDSPSSLVLGSDGWRPIAKTAKDPKADAEYAAAMKLFKDGKLAEAEKAFTQIAKDRKSSPWGENAQYQLAETQFARKHYIDAHDSYEKLHADYPGTDYLDKLASREYQIARLWFAQTDPKAGKDQKIPWYGRFDGRLPLIDVTGSALKALEHVQHNDPTGPLADVAALEVANFHMKHNDYESASIYFDHFIADHGKSPFIREAHDSAIEARMKSYLGPEYDASVLAKARDLVRKTMGGFNPDQATTEKLYRTLDKINDAEAEKTYTDGMYYKRVGKVLSAEYYLGKIPQRWPNSPWAVKAKSELAMLAKMPRTPSKPTKIMIPPGATDPYYSSGPGGGMLGGMGMGMGGMPMMGGMGGGMM